MLKGFRDFIMRGNVIDLAVAVVIGAAFGGVVKSLVDNIITPLISAVVGKPSLEKTAIYTVNGSKFYFGSFLSAVINFLLVAAAIYFFVIVPTATLDHRA